MKKRVLSLSIQLITPEQWREKWAPWYLRESKEPSQ